MHSSGSVIYTIIERLRAYLDAPDDKYDNEYLLTHTVMPAFVNVWARINLSTEQPILLRHRFTTVTGVQSYQLPPSMQEIWGVFQYEAESDVLVSEYVAEGTEWTPSGPGWRVEGNTIFFRPIPSADRDWDILYMPGGDFLMHYGQGTIGAGGSSITMASVPTIGQLDRRLNGYGGGMLRVISTADGTTNRVLEERIVRSFDPVTRVAVIEPALSTYVESDAVIYEIVPPATQNLASAVAALGAMDLGVSMNVSQKQMEFFRMQYLTHRKTVMDQAGNVNMRKPKQYDKGSSIDRSSIWTIR